MIHGCQSYHRCLPGNQAGGIEYYIYDKEHERARAQLPHAIPSSHIDDLRQFFLRENSHVRAIRCMADVEAATATLVLRHDVSTNELASFTLEEHGDDHVRSRNIDARHRTGATDSLRCRSRKQSSPTSYVRTRSISTRSRPARCRSASTRTHGRSRVWRCTRPLKF